MKKLLSVLLAAALIFAIAVPAFAVNSYTAVDGSTTTFKKYLTMDAEANVPNATFTYTIAAGDAAAAVAGSIEILAGITVKNAETNAVTAPTLTASVTFAPTDVMTAGLPTDAAGSPTAGKKYAEKVLTADFRGVAFPEPGIYRYVVTEAGDNQAITNDAILTRYLDVYVIDNNGSLEVASYVLHSTDASPVVASTGAAADDKSDGYTNVYTTYDLTLSKTVTGNQGSRDKYFAFTVAISDGVAGTKYTVDLSGADTTTGSNAATLDAYEGKTNPAEITLGADGQATVTYYLQHGQNIVIYGLAAGTKVEVTETNEDYTASYKVNNGTATAGAAATVSNIAADTTLAFTNDRSGNIPTGVILTVAPFVVMMLIGLAGIVFLSVKRRKSSRG